MIKKNKKFLKGYKFIDLFCGIGGFHLALSSFGAKCVFASEINKQAIDIYERNFKNKVSGDITKIDIESIPAHDIICAGFPCQTFSISGQKKGFEDPRGQLYKNVVNIAQYHKPKIIFLENVKNLETHNEGKTLLEIEEAFQNIGYTIFHKVLNSSDFGIPQARKRIYIVAFRNDLNVNNFKFPKPNKKSISLKSYLEENVSNSVFISNRTDITIDQDYINPKNELLRIGQVGKGRQGERIYSPLGHAITLSSQGGGIGGKTGMYLIDGIVRKLTGRECARLMGFPDDYIISPSLNTCYCQFGNSVVVDVLQEIIKEIIKYI